MDFFDYWPAIWRSRFWQTLGAVAVKGGLLFATTFLAFFALIGDTADRWSGSLAGDLAEPIAMWWSALPPWQWATLTVAAFAVGVAVYSSKRIWSAESGGGFTEAFNALRAIKVRFVDDADRVIYEGNGLDIFVEWGRFLLQPRTQAEWLHHVGYLVNQRRFPRDGEGDIDPFSWCHRTELDNALRDILDEFEIHSLAESCPSEENPAGGHMYRGAVLTEHGRSALVAARRLVRKRENRRA